MGTYSTQEYLDMFGGLPEPGETYPDDPDAVCDELEEEIRALEPCCECGGDRHTCICDSSLR